MAHGAQEPRNRPAMVRAVIHQMHQNLPKRLLPAVIPAPINGLRIGKVGENPRRRIGDDMVAFPRHNRVFDLFPASDHGPFASWWSQGRALASLLHSQAFSVDRKNHNG